MPLLIRFLIGMLPFGGPDGQGPVLVPLLISFLIGMLTFGGPDGQLPVLVPLLIKILIEMPPFGLLDVATKQKCCPKLLACIVGAEFVAISALAT